MPIPSSENWAEKAWKVDLWQKHQGEKNFTESEQIKDIQ